MEKKQSEDCLKKLLAEKCGILLEELINCSFGEIFQVIDRDLLETYTVQDWISLLQLWSKETIEAISIDEIQDYIVEKYLMECNK